MTPQIARRSLRQQHPLITQAFLWAIPAILLASTLRILFLSYSPYAYWGSDSWSYFGFSYQFLNSWDISLNEKRRYLYPIFLLPISILPGSPLKWLAVIQHAIGIFTLIPLAYVVRRCFVAWKWLVIPITLIWAAFPIILWYEHELLAENIFFAAVIWSLAGWMGWVCQKDPARARRLFWYFLAAFAVIALTKPAARFIWPGILLALVLVRSWKTLYLRHYIAVALLLAASLTTGQDSQSARLLYSSAFPLTRLDTEANAKYKAGIRPLVKQKRQELSSYFERDNDVKQLLKNPSESSMDPLWRELKEPKRTQLYKELAHEAILHRPDLFLYISLTRAFSSANQTLFDTRRFRADYLPSRFEEHYETMVKSEPQRLKMILGLSKSAPLPTLEETQRLFGPKLDSPIANQLRAYADQFAVAAQLHKSSNPKKRGSPRVISPLGWWLFLGTLGSLLPFYWRTILPWTILSLGYLCGVFLVGSENPRFFGVVLPIMVLLLALPFDAIARGILLARRRAQSPTSPATS